MAVNIDAVEESEAAGDLARDHELTIVIVDLQHLSDPVVDLLVVLLLLQPKSSLGLGDLLGLSSGSLELLDPLSGGGIGAVEVVPTSSRYTGSESGVDEGVVARLASRL